MMRRAAVAGLAAAGALGLLVGAAPEHAAPEPRPWRLVCFGDSITGHRPGEAYQGKYLKFADLLELILEGRLGLGRARVINSGWAGDATYSKPGQGMPGALGRLKKDLLDHAPDVAVVLIGGNDRQTTDAERRRTRRNLAAIVRRVRDAGIRLLLLKYHAIVPDPEHPEKAWSHVDDKNPLIAAVAGEADVPVLDMGPPMRAAMARHPRGDLVGADGAHLNPRGEVVYARAIFAKLDALGWIPARPRGEEAP